MATLTEVRRFLEADDLVAQMQQYAKGIESSSLSEIIDNFNKLESIDKSKEFQDLFSDPNSTARLYLNKTIGDAESYLNGISLQVAQPNNPGQYIDLYPGTATQTDGTINMNYEAWGPVAYNPYTGQYQPSIVPATLWQMLSNPNVPLMTDPNDCYFDNQGGAGIGLGTNWSESGQLNLNCTMSTGSSNEGQLCAAQGTLAQWAPFIHIVINGDPTALNRDVGLG